MNNTITKKEIIAKVAVQVGLSKTDSKEIFNDLIVVILEILTKYGKLKIHEFGSFIVRQKNKHIGMDFTTMNKIIVAEQKTVLFHPSRKVKKSLNKNV